MEQKSFDFNFFIGFMIIGFLLVLMMQPSFENLENEKNTNVNEEVQTNDFNKEDELLLAIENQFKDTVDIEESITILKNDNSKFKYLSFESNEDSQIPVKLISKDNSVTSTINLVKGQKNSSKFESHNDIFVLHEVSDNMILYKNLKENYFFKYTLDEDKLNFEIIGLEKSRNLNLYWEVNSPRQEKNLDSGFTSERNSSNLVYSTNQGKYKKLSFSGDDKVDDESDPISWIGYKQQFFSTILTSNSSFIVDYMKIKGSDIDSSVVKNMQTKLKINNNFNFSFLFVPNDYNYLKNLENPSESASYDNLVELGWGIFGWVNQFLVIPIFDFLENQGLGYGLIILVIALVFKMLLYIPTKKSYVSMAKMRVLKPEIDEINEKFKDKDPMEKQKAQMDLYKKTGVSPLGGCLPMLLQIPILFALFKFFPSSIQLRKQSFLWAEDLSTYDSVLEFSFWPGVFEHLSLFALLMSISTLVQMKFNAQPTNNQMPQLKYMMYIMPVVFFFIMNSYSSGLSYYYLLANIITFFQQLYIKRTLDEKQLYAQLQANKTKPIKKSNFQKKLEEIAKQQKRKKRR